MIYLGARNTRCQCGSQKDSSIDFGENSEMSGCEVGYVPASRMSDQAKELSFEMVAGEVSGGAVCSACTLNTPSWWLVCSRNMIPQVEAVGSGSRVAKPWCLRVRIGVTLLVNKAGCPVHPR